MKFNNYVKPWGPWTGAIVTTLTGFKYDNDTSPSSPGTEFYLYTSGINWVILPVGTDIDEVILDKVFMYSENRPSKSDKLSGVRATKPPKKMTTKQKEFKDQVRRDGGYTPPWSVGHKDGRYKDGYKFSSKKTSQACRTWGPGPGDRSECPKDWVQDNRNFWGPPPK